jgi:hypothetical protein
MRRYTIHTLSVLLCTALLAACGGSSSSSSSSHSESTGGSALSAVEGKTTTGSAKKSSGEKKTVRTSASTRSRPATHTRSHTGSGSSAVGNAGAGKPKLHATVYDPNAHRLHGSAAGGGSAALGPSSAPNPCTLVTRPEAQTALGGQLSSILEAPLGPTCIYQVKGQRQSFTLAVQTMNLQRHIAQMRSKPAQLNIAGHKAYCGTLGTSLLFVPLGSGRVLQVVAPCTAAAALAAKALPRIKA